MSLFVIFPFTRLVHVWSGFASVGYLGAPGNSCAAAEAQLSVGEHHASHRQWRRADRRRYRTRDGPAPRREQSRAPGDGIGDPAPPDAQRPSASALPAPT
ncbi:respiratory nitrate reductase subunit gamma [Cupriavidus basilensis]